MIKLLDTFNVKVKTMTQIYSKCVFTPYKEEFMAYTFKEYFSKT